MIMTKLEVVDGILALLDSESKWCRKAAARDSKGNYAQPWEEGATSWCVYGAGRKVMGLSEGKLDKMQPGEDENVSNNAVFWAVMRDIGQYDPYHPGSGTIGSWNDSQLLYMDVINRLHTVRRGYMEEEHGVTVDLDLSEGVRA